MLNSRIKSARMACGMSQQQAAKALDIGQSFLSKCERGDKHPSVELLSQMARLYGTTETYLIGRSEPDLPTAADATGGVLDDDSIPPGLRALATDRGILESLNIDAEEWRALRSLDLPAVSKGGYIQLLSTIRGIREQSARYETRGRPATTPETEDSD